MTKRTFTLQHQMLFAELAADFNPFHIDPLAARRLLGGTPVVHGIHAFLWGMEQTFPKSQKLALDTINVQFLASIRVDETVVIKLHHSDNPLQVNFAIQANGEDAVTAQVKYRHNPNDFCIELETQPDSYPCCELTPDKIKEAKGPLPLFFNNDKATELFPVITPLLPRAQFALMLAISRLVGMDCPGLHSILSAVEFDFSKQDLIEFSEFSVSKFDKRFNLIYINLTTPVGTGIVKSFLRPKPQIQISAAEAFKIVPKDKFKGQKALIVGGSRGLGEVTAKLLAAGGARVHLTYYCGKKDAERVVKSIQSAGGRASLFHLNILEPTDSKDQLDEINISHLYYFASPYIFSGQRGQFSVPLFNLFCDFYITGFINIFNALKGNLEYVFHPSTIAVETPAPDMGEYITAKSAMEGLCRLLSTLNRNILFACPRLPRLATDQTTSLYPVKNGDPVSEMLKHLRSDLEKPDHS